MFEKLIKKKRPFSLKVVIAARHFRPIVLCYLNLKRTPVATKILNCLKMIKMVAGGQSAQLPEQSFGHVVRRQLQVVRREVRAQDQ